MKLFDALILSLLLLAAAMYFRIEAASKAESIYREGNYRTAFMHRGKMNG